MHKGLVFVLQFLRHLIISQETLIYMGAGLVYMYCETVRGIFKSATLVNDNVLWVLGLLVAMCGYVCLSVKKVLWPDAENKIVLLTWPGYVQVQACCVAAIIHACAPIMVVVLMVLLPEVVTRGLRAYLLLTFVAVLALDALSCLFAPISLSQILMQVKGDASNA